MSSSIAPPRLTIPVSAKAHEVARKFAAEQIDAHKGKRVYLNTLAVWAVHRYLKWLYIESDLKLSNSWNPVLRALFDVADLVLPGLGRLECRPVLPGEKTIALPLQASPDRIGYVPVQFGKQMNEVELLGFASVTDVSEQQEVLTLGTLRLLDTLLEHLSDLEAAARTPQPTAPVNLSHWLKRNFEEGWQAVEELFGERSPSLAFRRAAMQRVKRIELQNDAAKAFPQEQSIALALWVTISPESEKQFGIHLQVYSTGEPAELPPHLQLKVLTATGEVFREVTAGTADTFLQYEFTAQLEETFQVELVWQNIYVTESFVV
ncbi:MAG: DUF1822 family protein [Leptolyngbyaceae cyanobacterium SM1_4_3]|nr:DUF1822 family protein [Leptolyngbyaceae cyanobacterium SM1_4_3]